MKYKGISIIKNKSCNTWSARPRINGKQIYISAKTQIDCYNKLKKVFSKINTKQETSKQLTFEEWYLKWLELYKINQVSKETLIDYKTLYNKIDISTKKKELKEISVEEIILNLKKYPNGRQKQKLYDFYNMILQKAEDNELISKNIIKRIERPKHTKEHGQALTNAQQKQLIQVCKNIEYGDIMIVAMLQGLRRGEVLGITIDNIDFEKNTLTINKAWKQSNELSNTKNKQSMRTMPLFQETKDILLKYKNQKERIFNISTKTYEKVIDEIKEKAKIENLKMKDMRSTFMTRCDELGIPERVYQAWAGHKPGSKVTKTTYVKHNSDVDNNYINIINNTKFYSNSTQNKK